MVRMESVSDITTGEKSLGGSVLPRGKFVLSHSTGFSESVLEYYSNPELWSVFNQLSSLAGTLRSVQATAIARETENVSTSIVATTIILRRYKK